MELKSQFYSSILVFVSYRELRKMQRLAIQVTLLLAFISFISARNINLSQTDLEALAKVLNVALHPDANKNNKFLQRHHGKHSRM